MSQTKWSLLFIVLCLVDITTTVLNIQFLGGTELNPLLRHVYDVHGLGEFIFCKMTLDFLGLCILIDLATPRAFSRIMTAVCTTMGLVVMYEVVGVVISV